ncbi:CDP-alcohol phosphatidyltransferase family protein [Pseudonocardia sp. RS11V-5]|uniref:CDP-alcohol phosphatidyltransferase family protein n=1 Tax=Pseudonocardia terrae TaxID=2905831 RepID=UPI001E54820C|nr:CDP-alcohol phosphatidyltransferase family protein [Pseudonocardia terrae]MCE3552589.1 CDP-alcohol phosphatidyltransferase family protein [Pseudonocardia terrae]
MYLQSPLTTSPGTALPLDRQQAAAAVLQLVLLAALTTAAGLGPAGWLAGVAYAAGLHALLAGAARRAGTGALGPADLVTLGRAVLIGGVTALVVDGIGSAEPAVVPLVGLATVALALDFVDGRVARRTGTVSALGARFDMETDAYLLLVLSVQVAAVTGPWVLAIGGLRYAFVAAGWLLPWLTGSLPARFSAKAVAAAQGIVLVVAAAGILPVAVAVELLAVALTALAWSFGRDTLLLYRTRVAS